MPETQTKFGEETLDTETGRTVWWDGNKWSYSRPASPGVSPPPTLTPQLRPPRLPLSYAQQRLWFLDRLEGTTTEYNIVEALHLRGTLDFKALKRTIATMVQRHEILRTHFSENEGEPVQIIEPALEIALPVETFSGLNDASQSESLAAAMRLERELAFDLSRGPLLRMKLLEFGPREHVLLRTFHHIICDGWSQGIFNREFMLLYENFQADRENPLPPLTIQYADYALWHRSWLDQGALAELLNYWKRQLSGIPEQLSLPRDRPRPAMQTFRAKLHCATLPPDSLAALKKLSRSNQASLYMTLLGAFAVLLGRYSRQDDIVVGSPIANRGDIRLEQLIGFFVNSLVMRVQINPRENFCQLLGVVKDTTLQAYAHQELPFEKLVEQLSPQRSLDRSPLFQVMFVLQNAPMETQQLAGLEVERVQVPGTRVHFDLELHVWERNCKLEFQWFYNRDLFDRWRIEQMGRHYARLLAMILATPDAALSDLEMLTAEERRQIVSEWNDTESDYPRNKCLHHLVEEQTRKTPNAIALSSGSENLTYTELNQRANQVAHSLRKLGAKPEARIGICMERGADLIIGLLGILKSGAAYVPLDPAYPQERLYYMLEDAQVSLLVTKTMFPQLFSGPTLQLDGGWKTISIADRSNPEVGLEPQNLAYVIYTSGSTGKPKGVAISHQSAAFLSYWAQEIFSNHELSGVIASTSICFDLSVFEIFVPLSCGGRVILVNNALDIATVAAEGATLVNTVPSLMTELLRNHSLPSTVQTVNLAGEALHTDLVNRIYEYPHVNRVFNLYGPSEDTTYSTYECVRRDHATPDAPIGRPIANSQAYVLDQDLNPAPVGVPGDLYLGGNGLARGYLNHPELTAERFVPDPFAATATARLYRTGDMARYGKDGRLEYLGRSDHQVKIRGFRIELGEIEQTMAEHPGVREAVVVARDDAGADKRLVAYYTCKAWNQEQDGAEREERKEGAADEQRVGGEQLRAYLLTRLPEYMAPAVYVQLESLPLTANGKLDRKALPQVQGNAHAERGYEVPQGEVERAVAAVWAEVLGLEQVGRHDNFFALGGHSLLGMRTVARMRTIFKVEIPVRLLFEKSTVRTFGQAICELASGQQARQELQILRIPREGKLPLSFNQQGRLLVEWWAEMRHAPCAPFHLFVVFSLSAEINIAVLEQALNALASRHEILRTSFSDPKKMPFSQLPQDIKAQLARIQAGEQITAQEMRDFVHRLLFGESIFEQTIHPCVALELRRIDLEEFSPESRDSELLRIATSAIETPFDYENAPLIRILLFRKLPAQQFLLIVMPHLLGDAWGLEIFRRELGVLYEACMHGTSCRLPEVPIQSVDFAAWQRKQLQGSRLEEMASYWKQRWSEFSLLDVEELPFAKPSSEAPGFIVERVWQILDQSLSTDLRSLLRKKNLTLHMLWLTALNILLHLYTRKERIGVWGLFANRLQPETENLMGWLANGHIMGVHLDPEQDINSLLAHVKEVVLEAQSHQEIPMALLWSHFMKDMERNPGAGRSSIQPHISFVTETQTDPQPAFEETEISYRIGRLALKLVIMDHHQDIRMIIHYSADRFSFESIGRMMADWQQIVRKIVDAPSSRISEFSTVLQPVDSTGPLRVR